MPIDYGIDRERRLVVAAPFGVMTDEDTFGYQRDVWSLPEVAGFDELIDMSAVESIALPSAKRVEDLARLSAQMDWEAGLTAPKNGDLRPQRHLLRPGPYVPGPS